MKKSIIIFSVFVLILSVLNVSCFATGTPRIYIEDSIKYENKENVTVSIYMENTNQNIVALGLDLKYDTSKLEYVSSKAGKDLSATLKLDEDIPEESRVAIAIISMTGLKNNGLYYQITFKVKDASQNIPLELSLREASDSDGNEIKVETVGGKIEISSQEIKEEKKVETKIEDFEVTNVEELTTIEELITESANVEIGAEDVITYEVLDSSVAEILHDGTIIPNKDGTSKVKVKMNGQDIGTVEVTVKNGTIEKVSGTKTVEENSQNIQDDEKQENDGNLNTTTFESSATSEQSFFETENEMSDKNQKVLIIMIIVIIIIILIILFMIKRKKEKKR